MRQLFFLFTLTLITGYTCKQETPTISKALSNVPKEADAAQITVTDLNYWVENGQFFVIGICNNQSDQWQKIWLKMLPMDAQQHPIDFNGAVYNTFRVLSDAVPPKGRSSFFAYWPVNLFKSTPNACQVTGAGAMQVLPGAILIAEETGGIRLIDNQKIKDTTQQIETRWLAKTTISNPLNMEASNPKIELLLYGTDNKLWMSSLLDPNNNDQKQVFTFEKYGPMAPGEKRKASIYIYYDLVPGPLKKVRIGKIEFLPFNAR
jgi:hypothetical protein